MNMFQDHLGFMATHILKTTELYTVGELYDR